MAQEITVPDPAIIHDTMLIVSRAISVLIVRHPIDYAIHEDLVSI